MLQAMVRYRLSLLWIQVVKKNIHVMKPMVNGALSEVIKTAPNAPTSANMSIHDPIPLPTKAQHGFTLIELIIVIILISIVALVAVPRFTGTSGYTEYTMQKRLIAALRNLQLKAIYDTRTDFCYKMVLDTDSSPEFGPTTASYLSGQELTSCAATIDFTSEAYTRTDLGEMANDSLMFSALDAVTAITFIEFDNIGRAVTDVGTCAASCTFSFSGESNANVCIASEGYIYAC